MGAARFSIGIDLGTTNCAMAHASLESETAPSEVFLIPQWESLTGIAESSTLPSFLYLPRESESFAGSRPGQWIAGRFARKQAGESPHRVVHSAKSWLGHHGADRSAPFLPWRSDEVPVEKRISPIAASAMLLSCLQGAWNARFRHAPFEEQEVTITVPASFDAAAQTLTLEAAKAAGYPRATRLLEEPQAAFYRWLEQHGSDLPQNARHVLVIDIGGGTTDFSLFEIAPATPLPKITRLAVSDHLLLGGDNIDLALAHHLEKRLGGSELSPAQWGFLVSRCRDLKERCLSESLEPEFSVAVPSRGSGLIGGALTGRISRGEVDEIVIDGFFPNCGRDDRPDRTQAALREWALPYAADSAVTRYLAGFLDGRPSVDAILFNGGSLYPQALRLRLQQLIGHWQEGREPSVLENPEPDLAVARGAARFGRLVYHRAARIEAGAARAIYLEVHRPGGGDSPQLLCVLPRGAAAEEESRISDAGIELRVNRPVRFQAYSSTRDRRDRAGALVAASQGDFHRLPPLQTTAKIAAFAGAPNRIPVTLAAKFNEIGLLQIACISTDPRVKQTWPLDFNLRPLETTSPAAPPATGIDRQILAAAGDRIRLVFSKPPNPRDKITANTVLKNLEQILRMPRSEWSGALVRALWQPLEASAEDRRRSPDHEEAWLILAGFLLRPGFGAEGDPARIDRLWNIQWNGRAHPGKRIDIQHYVLWRRVAGGLDAPRQQMLLAPELPRLRAQKEAPAELVRLAGSLERLEATAKNELVGIFLEKALSLARDGKYASPYLDALGLLLNRAPLFAGPECVLPPERVEETFESLKSLDWRPSELGEISTLFLRAARVTEHEPLNVRKDVRGKIAARLESAGVPPARTGRLKTFVPIQSGERGGIFGESLPSGLVLGD